MEKEWVLSHVQKYIDDMIEESLTLDYKAANALSKSDMKKSEITKDISAMANSAGGIIIYGVKEYDEPNRRHLPQRIDPIAREDFSKEWIEQIINNIQPRIDGIVIYPVEVSGDDAVYVVEIPQSKTAHQARDFRYYKRFNFESVPMYDYEVRDVMNRAITPDVIVEFSYKQTSRGEPHKYVLGVKVVNYGNIAVENFKLEFVFPDYGSEINYRTISNYNHPFFGLISYSRLDNGGYSFIYHSKHKLFPKDEVDIGKELALNYSIDDSAYHRIKQFSGETRLAVEWTLYADNMAPKHGKVPFDKLNNF